MRAATAVLLGAFCLALPATSPATTHTVDWSGGGDYLTIQAGLDAAAPGDTILVAPGTYTGGENRNLTFGGKELLLRAMSEGGAVVIDCEISGRGFDFSNGEGPGTVADGFDIVNGFRSEGGGITCIGSSPTVRNCRISSCEAHAGGGVNIVDSSFPVFEDCVITNCWSEYLGGGLRVAYDSSPELTRVIFFGNESYYGGGMISGTGCDPTLTDCVFDDNTAEMGAGILFDGGAAELESTLFLRNHATELGGGVSTDVGASPTFSHCTFFGNTADHAGGGCDNGTPAVFQNCTFVRNAALLGGGLFIRGPSGSAEITNTIVAFSTEGKGVHCAASAGIPTITRSDIFGNAGGDDLCGVYYDNLFVDPMFCSLPMGDVTVDGASQCLPENNIWGELIGARGFGCATTWIATDSSWGVIKSMYR
jgi:hypothetical protein